MRTPEEDRRLAAVRRHVEAVARRRDAEDDYRGALDCHARVADQGLVELRKAELDAARAAERAAWQERERAYGYGLEVTP